MTTPVKGTEIVWAFDPTAARRMLVDVVCLKAQEDDTCRAGKSQRERLLACTVQVGVSEGVGEAELSAVAREVTLAASQR
jgi:hypothetical protein